MTDILFLLIGAILVNNFVLTQSSAVYPVNTAAGKLHTVVALAAATSLVLTASSICTYFVYHSLLLPFDLVFLRTVTYILIIAILANLSGIIVRKVVPEFSRMTGIFIPLLTTNAVVLGVALINDNKSNTFAGSVFYGLAAAAGFSLLLILFSVLRERLVMADVPRPFQGSAITLITAGLISLSCMGLAGLG